MNGPILNAYLCFFKEADAGPRHPISDGNKSLLFRFSGDPRDFGALAGETGAPIAAGETGAVTLAFLVREANEVAQDGALFDVRLGPRLVGIGCLSR
jgi:hypothetical protein